MTRTPSFANVRICLFVSSGMAGYRRKPRRREIPWSEKIFVDGGRHLARSEQPRLGTATAMRDYFADDNLSASRRGRSFLRLLRDCFCWGYCRFAAGTLDVLFRFQKIGRTLRGIARLNSLWPRFPPRHTPARPLRSARFHFLRYRSAATAPERPLAGFSSTLLAELALLFPVARRARPENPLACCPRKRLPVRRNSQDSVR